MALATAKLFVEEGAYVFITGRRQQKLDEAVKAIGKNVTGVQGDASNLADLDRLYDMVKQKKGRIDVLFASAGYGDLAPIGAMTQAHFDKVFGVNVRGTVFTVQKALPLFSDGGSIIMNASIASVKGLPGLGAYCASKAALRFRMFRSASIVSVDPPRMWNSSSVPTIRSQSMTTSSNRRVTFPSATKRFSPSSLPARPHNTGR